MSEKKYKVLTRKRNSSYSYRFEIPRVNGKRTWITKSGFKSEEDAYRAGVIAVSEYENGGEIVDYDKLTYSDYLDNWLTESSQKRRYNTLQSYRTIANLYIKPKIGKYVLNKINIRTLNTFLRTVIDETNFSVSYYKNILKVVKASFKDACRDGYILQNPSVNLVLPDLLLESECKKEKNNYNKNQVNKIIERFKDKDNTFLTVFLLARTTGMRPGEIFALTWDNIDFSNNIIHVLHSVYDKPSDNLGRWFIGPTKSVISTRDISMNDYIKKLLLKFKDEQDYRKKVLGSNYVYYDFKNPKYEKKELDIKRIVKHTGNSFPSANLIFTREDGTYVGTDLIKYPFKIIHNELGIKNCRFYDNRSTFATELANSGIDREVVKDLLGHTDVSITDKYYIKENKEAKRKIISSTMKESEKVLLTEGMISFVS